MGVEVQVRVNSALVGGEWSASHPDRFTTGIDPRCSLGKRVGRTQHRFGRCFCQESNHGTSTAQEAACQTDWA
jgi:hypothetical protein